jgi:hypothetical protein
MSYTACELKNSRRGSREMRHSVSKVTALGIPASLLDAFAFNF